LAAMAPTVGLAWTTAMTIDLLIHRPLALTGLARQSPALRIQRVGT
jgi:hypothetical protein